MQFQQLKKFILQAYYHSLWINGRTSVFYCYVNISHFQRRVNYNNNNDADDSNNDDSNNNDDHGDKNSSRNLKQIVKREGTFEICQNKFPFSRRFCIGYIKLSKEIHG